MPELRKYGWDALELKKYNQKVPAEKQCPMYSKNFSKQEMRYSTTAFKNNIDNYPPAYADKNLAKLCKNILQPIRDKWGKPLIVSSGYRSIKLNNFIGGSKTSQHTKGEAADILPSLPEDFDKLKNLVLQMIENKEITVGQFLIESKTNTNKRTTRWLHISLPTEKHNNDIRIINK